MPLPILAIASMVLNTVDIPDIISSSLSERKNKKNKSLKQDNKSLINENKKLLERLNDVGIKTKARCYIKIGILHNLAWKDGILHNKETLFLYDYIINKSQIPNDEKIIYLNFILTKPKKLELTKPKKKIFSNFFSKEHYKKDDVFNTTIEANEFKSILFDLAKCDDNYSSEEETFINAIIKQLKI